MTAELKLVIGNKDGKSYSKTLEDNSSLIGRKVGEDLKGEAIGLNGYEFKITGGSNNAGFPMRPEINVTGTKKIYAKSGIGVNTKFKGNFIRKTVVGNTIGEKIVQLNLSVIKVGSKSLKDLLGKKEAKEGEEDSKEVKKEAKEVKPEIKAEEKKEEVKKEIKETKEELGDESES